ncbi:MAG TPA: hypothetical protein VIN03_20005 [Roseateles sp.]
MNAWARGLLVVVLAIGVLGFGAMGLCGGIFTVSILTDLQAGGMLILTLPCLIGGFVMAVVCARKISALLHPPSSEDDRHE